MRPARTEHTNIILVCEGRRGLLATVMQYPGGRQEFEICWELDPEEIDMVRLCLLGAVCWTDFHWLFSEDMICSTFLTNRLSIESSERLYGEEPVRYRCFWYSRSACVDRYCIQFSWSLRSFDIPPRMAIEEPSTPTIQGIHGIEVWPDKRGMNAARIVSAICMARYLFLQDFACRSYHSI